MRQCQSAADKVELLKVKIKKAQEMIQLKRKEAQANIERHAKAEWAISLCTRQVLTQLLNSSFCDVILNTFYKCVLNRNNKYQTFVNIFSKIQPKLVIFFGEKNFEKLFMQVHYLFIRWRHG